MVGTADNVLIREVSLIQSVLYREVPLYGLSIVYKINGTIGICIRSYVHHATLVHTQAWDIPV